MTFTETKCTSFVINSDYFQDLIDDSPSPGYTLNLTITLNAVEVLNEDLEAADVAGAVYTYATTDGGFYLITITKTLTGSSSSTGEEGCLWWDCDTVECDMIDYLASNDATSIDLYYKTLESIKFCNDCSCTNAYKVWTKLNTILSGNTIDDDCGCN